MVNISRTITQESISNDPSYHQLLLVLRQGFLLTKSHLFGSYQHSSSFTLRVSAVEKIFLCLFGHISTFADLSVSYVCWPEHVLPRFILVGSASKHGGPALMFALNELQMTVNVCCWLILMHFFVFWRKSAGSEMRTPEVWKWQNHRADGPGCRDQNPFSFTKYSFTLCSNIVRRHFFFPLR